MNTNWDLIVIGGGPAGLMAAGQAALTGKKVVLFEKMNRPGRKLSITGKGRCNITNSAPLAEFINQVQPNKNFLRSAFSQFYSDELIDFMHGIGVKTIHERGGRIFPESGKAVEVTKCLVDWCKKTGVKIHTSTSAKSLIIKEQTIKGVVIATGKELKEVLAPKVIVTTGGMSYPATGSTGDGYQLAASVGHKTSKCFPSLVPLVTREKILPSLSGLELKNCDVTLWIDGKKKENFFGELYFMDYGVSGPIILSLSRIAVPLMRKKQKIEISIDFKPALDHQKLDKRITRDFNEKGKESLYNILRGLMPVKLIETSLKSTGLESDKPGNQVSGKEKKKLRNWLKEYRLTIVDHRSFDEAIITSGGISTSEIDQRTMESKLVKGLFFAGEVIDLDGPTGGYNLQIAFSTGFVAGIS